MFLFDCSCKNGCYLGQGNSDEIFVKPQRAAVEVPAEDEKEEVLKAISLSERGSGNLVPGGLPEPVEEAPELAPVLNRALDRQGSQLSTWSFNEIRIDKGNHPEDQNWKSGETHATDGATNPMLRRGYAESRLDLLSPIEERKAGNRITLAIRRATTSLAGFLGGQSSLAAEDRETVLLQAIFGDFLTQDGSWVEQPQAWREEVQEDFLEEQQRRSAKELLNEVLAASNLPHTNRKPEGLDRPISQYWINSSHNSYLSGNQLTSDSSTDALVSLLQNGCRVVELDVYDGKKYGMEGPCVLHGGTATSAVSFQACLEAIREAAFERSMAPVIITLENHTKDEGQRQVANLLLQSLGQTLYVPPSTGFPETWPSPDQLLGKFLLRDKKVKASGDAENPWVPDKVKELYELISVGNVKFLGLQNTESYGGCTSSSFSERKVTDLAKNGLEEIRSYTTRHVARVYPAGYRVDSSNYDPQDAWEAGCQMVALNGQTSIFFHPHSAWLNAGKFRGNGGCGYIEKPAYLSYGLSPEEGGGGKAHKTKLAVTVLGGDGWETFQDFDLLGPPDSYVCVEIGGATADRIVERTNVFTPRARTGSKAQPLWKQRFEFVITEPALATLLLAAWDHDMDFDDLLGQYAFPVNEIRPGWRRVPLLSSTGEPQDGDPALICRFEFL